jgi:hypothetical protein
VGVNPGDVVLESDLAPSISLIVASGDLSPLTTTDQDIPGTTQNFTVTGAHAYALFIGTICWACTGASAGNVIGDLLLDGSHLAGSILDTTNTTYGFRTGTQVWTSALAAGNHSARLQARKDAAGATAQAKSGSSTLAVLLYDIE